MATAMISGDQHGREFASFYLLGFCHLHWGSWREEGVWCIREHDWREILRSDCVEMWCKGVECGCGAADPFPVDAIRFIGL